MAQVHQQNVALYHATMSQHAHHGGHDMYIFHRNWHQQNRDPQPPARPDRDWGTNLVFGTNFLQMHHEMIKATATEAHQHKMHDSILSWYQQQNIIPPSTWDTTQPIPVDLSYEPDPTVFPIEIRQAIQLRAQQMGVSEKVLLTRITDNPQFELPRYFTRLGIDSGDEPEPITGARKLADFKNINQLGCCMVFPHNEWHGTIGGAMNSTWTAIADPIFYFGVHWHVDRVFDEYKLIMAEIAIRSLDFEMLFELNAFESNEIVMPDEFTDVQKEWRHAQIELSNKLNSL